MTDYPWPWDHPRPYNAYVFYLKKLFGSRMQKLSLDAGFTCPNRDGRVAVGGCTFCDNDAFNPSYCDKIKPIAQQIQEGIEFHHLRYKKAGQFVAYFQAYSNTYAPLSVLKQRYQEALDCEQIQGLVIGTRPDCLPDDVLAYLGELSQKYFIQLELGIESCYDKSLLRVNRGHDYEQTVDAFERAVKYPKIHLGAHLILGLPGESRQESLDMAAMVSKLPISSLKLHQLQIIKGTDMEREYREHPENFNLFAMEEYVDFVVDFLERLNPRIMIERLSGEIPPQYRVNEGFGNLRNDVLLNRFEQRLLERRTFQGKLYQEQN